MSTGESRSKPLSSAIRPTERWAVFGLPPLIDSEALSNYEELYAGISEAIKPADILEKIWICDIVDRTWEVLRLRRVKANLINASAIKLLDQGPDVRVVKGDAQTLSQDLDQIEQIERMTAVAEVRRNNALHEIERHRATFADAPRRNVRKIEEGDYQVVGAESVEESDRA